MKQIVKKLSVPNIVDVNRHDFDTSRYYGVLMHQANGGRGFIMMMGYCSNAFRVVCTDGLTHCNGWYNIHDAHSLRDAIRILLDDDCEVYEFDTFKELTDWLNGI